ncbi:hypothetical protein [Brevifollis gellanilyticus]|uniref:Tail protein n=1 Tax=Brevifollis gellanilyticus TaxID=748831 RepID=A0A512MIA6_9BACT|nr:hypothetical protein [Brevifollis gellanilyticus]GEP46467.1 hypothetical protein BGE01nite_57580 [Brevifollis gellanilyticus]
MSLTISVKTTDTATPVLERLQRALTDRTKLNEHIASAAEAGTRTYLRKIAQERHGTANRMGATPTGYLVKRAELVKGQGTKDGAVITFTGAIFRRIAGPVTIRPKAKKMLAIPMRAESYGKRPAQFNDLFVYRAGQGRAFLARKAGEGRLHFYFLLKSVVTLPQDRTLAPSDEEYAKFSEEGARAYLASIEKSGGK